AQGQHPPGAGGMTLYLSRLNFVRDPSVAALGALLEPDAPGQRLDAYHRLVWSAFADDSKADRRFLFRAEGRGRFLVLSHVPPVGGPLFEPPEVKLFEPNLDPGDRLSFDLKVNATRTVKTGKRTPSGTEHKVHRDIVMQALHGISDRRERRMDLAQREGTAWLAGQGDKAGFDVDDAIVSDYSTVSLPGRDMRRPRFGILDMAGTLTVNDPSLFVDRLARGFGRAKAFGCGLMLIRRA
ncbi:MAG: type I-E CRISPR-associated protein Cas6/Cse3/CasE, partial [Pseudomonadota bacterium]